MQIKRPLCALVVALCCSPAAAYAQASPTSQGADRTRLFCFTPGALPRCRTYAITELSLSSARFAEAAESAGHLEWSAGLGWNIDRKQGVGVAVHLGEVDSDRWGASLRYRRNVFDAAALQGAVGFSVLPVDGVEGREVRPTADVSMVFGSWLGVFARGTTDARGVRLGAGARLAAWPGLIAVLVSQVVVGLVPVT